ncbi:MAG: SPOR domain-containing protein [Lautropia sp.]
MNAIAAQSRQRGGTYLGILIGIVLGLAAAVVTALFVTKANVPFIGGEPKSGLPQVAATPPAQDAGARAPVQVPDPNRSLSRPREAPAARRVEDTRVAPVVAPPAPEAPAATPARPGPAPVIVATPSVAPRAQPQIATAPQASPRAEQATTYLLQAGAFRSGGDAESMKAKLALMGFEASVVQSEINGSTLYRVRVGPYQGLDPMNRARARLAENGIEASVLRQR